MLLKHGLSGLTYYNSGVTAAVINSVTVGAYSAGELPVTIDASGATDGVDTVYCVLIPTGDPAPNATEVKAGQASGGGAPLDAFSFTWDEGTPTASTIASGIDEFCDLYAVIDNGALSNVGSDTNFEVDSTAPVLSSPTGTQTGQTTADGSVTSDEAQGTIYAGVWPTASSPSFADVKAGTGATYHTTDATPTAGVNNFSATGLTASTAYKWHYVQEDEFGVQSNVATSAEFTTAAAASGAIVQEITPQTIDPATNSTSLTWSGITLPAGDYLIYMITQGPTQEWATAVTVDGNAATERNGTASDLRVKLWTISLASPISAADIVATVGGTNDFTFATIDVYRVPAGYSALGDSNVLTQNFVDNLSQTVDIAAGQTVVGYGVRSGSGGFTWSGAAEEKVSDDTVGSAYWSLAYETGLGVETGRSVGWTCGASETRNLIVLNTLTP